MNDDPSNSIEERTGFNKTLTKSETKHKEEKDHGTSFVLW